MPPSAITTIKEVILWEYARLMSEETLANRKNWCFTLRSFEQLNYNERKWLSILQEEVKIDHNKCIYCGSEDSLSISCVVPKNICPFTKKHNIIRACKKCSLSKGDKDLIEWWGAEKRDEIPRVVMGKYLKIWYICHECNGTLDNYAINKYGKVDLSALIEVTIRCKGPKITSKNPTE